MRLLVSCSQLIDLPFLAEQAGVNRCQNNIVAVVSSVHDVSMVNSGDELVSAALAVHQHYESKQGEFDGTSSVEQSASAG